MCGLTGFFSTKQVMQNSESVLLQMLNQLTHRGPDDHGLWVDQQAGIALGHRRLAIMDLTATGHQPMHSQNKRYIIVYNGEIYNAQALKASLAPYPFCSHSDTEVLLALIEAYGLEHALNYITGMFAFALWDKQERLLHLVRDRIGEKPLYYGLVKQTLLFASELNALKAHPYFSVNIAQKGVSAFMQYGYIPAPYSIYENIYKLMPGTYLTFSQTETLPETKRYWSPKILTNQTSQALSDQEAIQQLDEQLNQIVRDRMISDVPIGAFLSGGIDSTVITALMQANSTRPIKTFTIGFNEQGYNEADHAKAIANYLKTDHTELYVGAKEALNVIPRLPQIYSEPFADSSAIPTFLVSKLAKQHVTVSLSGDGGDELFGGYNRYLWGQTIWSGINLTPSFVRNILQKLLFTSARLAHASIQNKLTKFAKTLTANSPIDLYQQLISQTDPRLLLVQPNDFHLFQQYEDTLFFTKNFIEKMMIADTLSYLPDDIMVKVDRAGMAVSLENRAPFLDHRLFEWSWSLPLNMKIRNRSSKWLLRQVLANYVPNRLTHRPKMGFGIPLAHWLRDPLRDWAENLLNESTIVQQGFLNATMVREKWHQHLSGKRNWQYELWTILMFQAWMEECKSG